MLNYKVRDLNSKRVDQVDATTFHAAAEAFVRNAANLDGDDEIFQLLVVNTHTKTMVRIDVVVRFEKRLVLDIDRVDPDFDDFDLVLIGG